MFLSSLNVRYRDIRQGTALLLQMGMYVTPVIWPIDQVRRHFPSMYWLIGLNPLASVVGGFRAGLLGLEPVPMRMMALSAASAGAMLVLGLWYFHKTEDVIADIV